MMKQGSGDVSEDTTRQKGKQTELMWLLVPICKVFSSPENFLTTPTFTLSALPAAPSLLGYTHHGACLHLWSRLACWIFFMSTARGPSQAARTLRMGRGEEGTDLYSGSHRHRFCTSSKAKIEEKSHHTHIHKNYQEDQLTAQLCWFEPTREMPTHPLMFPRTKENWKKKVKRKHTPCSVCVGGCEGNGHWGGTEPPSRIR